MLSALHTALSTNDKAIKTVSGSRYPVPDYLPTIRRWSSADPGGLEKDRQAKSPLQGVALLRPNEYMRSHQCDSEPLHACACAFSTEPRSRQPRAGRTRVSSLKSSLSCAPSSATLPPSNLTNCVVTSPTTGTLKLAPAGVVQAGVVQPCSRGPSLRLLHVPTADCPAPAPSTAQVISLDLPMPVERRPAADHRRLFGATAPAQNAFKGLLQIAEVPPSRNGLNRRRSCHDFCRNTYRNLYTRKGAAFESMQAFGPGAES